jgi:hypothetical protein
MRTSVLTLLATVIPVMSVSAQSPVQVQFGPSTPSRELGAHVGIWSLMGSDNLWGVRYGRRAAEWLVAEWTYDKSSNSNPYREHRLLMTSVRLQPTHAPKHRRPFVTAGLAVASGLSYSWSPMIGLGGQAEVDNGAGALRIELQIFTRARDSGLLDRGRLVMGLSFGLP